MDGKKPVEVKVRRRAVLTSALPQRFYGDPAENVDEWRRVQQGAKRQAEALRKNKARRIQALTRQVKKKGGGQ